MNEYNLKTEIVNLKELLSKAHAKFETIDEKCKKLKTENDQLKGAFQKRTIGTSLGML
jgi:predicted nuclease with TOPRIM domain